MNEKAPSYRKSEEKKLEWSLEGREVCPSQQLDQDPRS